MNKRLYEYYPQPPVRFVPILANCSEPTYFFNYPSFMILTPPFCLLFACFLQFVFFSKYFKYVVLLGVSYRTWNSTSVTFFANKDDYSINKEWRQKMTLFRLQKETSCLKVNK